MTIQPIYIDEDPTKEIYANEFCREIFQSYPAYYHKTGYNPPWIGYWIYRDDVIAGVGGFVGRPANGKVEIAYGTFKKYEGQGVASFACTQLISIALANEPGVTITAKTEPRENASTKILKRNGFAYNCIVQDEGIGPAWEWIYQHP